jgi:epsin
MAKEKASAGIWGAPASSGLASQALFQQQQSQQGAKTNSSAFDDLLG